MKFSYNRHYHYIDPNRIFTVTLPHQEYPAAYTFITVAAMQAAAILSGSTLFLSQNAYKKLVMSKHAAAITSSSIWQ